jgi:hypothetical protein
MECEYVSDVKESGPNIEFRTYLYSTQAMATEPVLISCPVSGNYILTESAKIVEGNVGDCDHQKLLEQLFYGLESSAEVGKKIESNEILIDSSETKLQKVALSFIKKYGSNDTDIETIRFDFLKNCSEGFQKAYEHYSKNQK